MRIGTFTFEEYCDAVRRFHGTIAPGMLIGGFMVESARNGLPGGTLFEALCETRACLPDAIQLLTPCTVGNGRLRVMHVGRYAFTLYDKQTGEGVRTFLDAGKLAAWPETQAWFLKLKPKASQDRNRLLDEIREGGPAILSVERKTVKAAFLGKKKLGAVCLCPGCGEAYPSSDGGLCGGCRGELPYAAAGSL